MSSHMLRHHVIDIARRMGRAGLNRGTSGNVSARMADGFLVTPSGIPPEALHPADIVAVDMDGEWCGQRKPSSEWRFHRDLYRTRPDVGAVVHAHAPFSTTLAVLGRGIPAFHYMVAMLGGRDVRCAPYATYGTQALSDNALAALEGRKACLLANHGMLAVGCDLDDALDMAVELESLAEQYWRAVQVGEPLLLPDDEMDRVIEKFKGYGRNAQRDGEG